jgi:hypothetical protein
VKRVVGRHGYHASDQLLDAKPAGATLVEIFALSPKVRLELGFLCRRGGGEQHEQQKNDCAHGHR